MTDIFQIFRTIIKSLFNKSACDMYPVKPAKFYDKTKGHIAIEAKKCILCTMCAKKCPTGAITVNRAGREWAIDFGKCILCNACTEVCPPKCLSMHHQYSAPVTEQKLHVVKIPVSKKPKTEQVTIT